MRQWRLAVLLGPCVLSLLASPVQAQSVSCTGVPAWNATTLYNPGNRVVYQGSLYEALVSGANIPPNYCPACGWWRLLGSCSGGGGGGDTTPPSVPGGLRSTGQTTSSIALAWNASTDNPGGSGLAGYDVFRNGAMVGSTAATAFNNTGLAANTAFSFTVRARDVAGNASAQSAALSVRTLASSCNTLPSVPGNLRSTGTTSSSISLAWNASTAGAGCTVQYRVFQNGTQAAQTAATSITISGLPASTSFTFTVAALNEFGSSAQSAALTVSTMAGGGGGGGGGAFPSRIFAPYVDVLLGDFDAFKLAGNMANVSRFYTLAFITAAGCEARWGGIIPLGQDGPLASDIAALRAAGGNVIVSFGGASGIELAQACTTDASLLAQYQAVVTRYNLRRVDFDIEGAAVADPASRARRNRVLRQLKANNPGLVIQYTLPVLQSGLTDGVALLQDARANGFTPDVVNIMAMDYGGAVADMGGAAIQAIDSTAGQLQTIFGFTQAQARAHLGVTPMIGVNDVPGETFTLGDAGEVLSAAQGRGLSIIAMWSANRDHQCTASETGLFQCSRIQQAPFAFSQTFRAFTN